MPELDAEPPAAPAPRVISIRTRVLAALVAATLALLAVSGTVTYLLERGLLEDRVDAHLKERDDQVRALSRLGTDPITGERLTTVDRLLRAAMQSSLPGPNDGEIGVVERTVALIGPESTRVRPEDDPALVQEVTAGSASVRIDTVRTPRTTYRYIVVPVTVSGDPRPATLVAVVDLHAEYDRLNANFCTSALVGLGSALLVALLAWLLLGRLLQPLTWVRRTAERITEHDLSERIPVRGGDDLAELTRTINAMLGRIEATFDAQRQLQDDVGHELRTPLTIMRGHLELMDADDTADVCQTRAIALSEIDRMAGLVEDLVTLSKAERPDFVARVPTDVGSLVDGVVEKARALGDRRWTISALPDGVADLDPRRISQALLELCRNALKFSDPGTEVSVGGAVDADRVRLWVRDGGWGIPADRVGDVTERFSRVHDDVEGSGLGLAIVRSIAQAHGGEVRVESVSGRGTTATLDLARRAD